MPGIVSPAGFNQTTKNMNVLEIFEQREVDMIIEALTEKSNKHRGIYKRTLNSGYGTANTEFKALEHKKLSDDYWELCTKIAENSI